MDDKEDKPILPKKILPEELPSNIENGCIIIDDSVTDEQIANIKLTD